MSSQTEITVANYRLKENEGNIKALAADWNDIPSVELNIISLSHGGTAVSLERGLLASERLRQSMSSMLENSILFFESTGIKFADADNASASQIQSVN